jgi:mRNA interferase RelE/StbE
VGQALKGSALGSFWKYRLGDIRIIASIEDDRLVILVLRVGNRKEIYKR